MKCKDCKGTGVYLGLERQEVCARCGGSCVEPEYDIEQKPLPRFEWEPKEAPPYAEAIRDWHEQRDQLARLHNTPQDQLADAIRELQDPLPQVVFELDESTDSATNLITPSERWRWLNDSPRRWFGPNMWCIMGTLATPGPEPAPDAPVLRIETVEALEALVERYRDA